MAHFLLVTLKHDENVYVNFQAGHRCNPAYATYIGIPNPHWFVCDTFKLATFQIKSSIHLLYCIIDFLSRDVNANSGSIISSSFTVLSIREYMYFFFFLFQDQILFPHS